MNGAEHRTLRLVPPSSQDGDGTPPRPPRVCPRCAGPIDRVRRRAVDRLLSLVVPVQRFRCSSFGCNWCGLLRERPSEVGLRAEAQTECQPATVSAKGGGSVGASDAGAGRWTHARTTAEVKPR